jgi:chromosome segregation ATPase
MRDLKALLESQEVDLDHNTVNRALELNGELAKLKEENEKLKKENRRRKDKEELLLEEVEQREEILAATEAEIKRLKEETHRQKVSLDSLFSDLEESQKLVRKLRKDIFDRKLSPSQSSIDPNPRKKEEGKAQFLTPTGSGKPVQSNSFFSGLGGASAQQRKIYNLEKENVKLKS